MSLPPFIDGFPNQAQAAVNFSYFLTPEEKAEWTSWLTSANDEQQDELITILHQMWEQSKASTVPNGFGGQTNVQPVAPTQPQPMMQTQPMQQQTQQVPAPQDPSQLVGQMPPAIAAMGQFGGQSNQSSQMAQAPLQQQQPQVQPAPAQPAQPQQYNNPFVNEDPKAKEIEKADMMASEPTYAPNPIISNPESVEGVDFKADMNKIPEPQTEEEDDFEFESEEEATNYKPAVVETKKSTRSEEQAPENETEEELETETATAKPERRTTTSGIDFSVIRESSNKAALANLKEEYINARETQEAVYGDFVTKTTEILSNFEDINDYIEAMTDKVLSINDEVVSQAQEIQDLKSGTQTRGAALQDQVDELRYDLEKVSKELRNVRIEIKRSNDEIRQRLSLLEADSFRQANDGIESRFALIKSEMSKMQEVLSNQSNGSLNQVANNFSLPQQSPRISRLSSVNFKK
jgi:hypothetical protein